MKTKGRFAGSAYIRKSMIEEPSKVRNYRAAASDRELLIEAIALELGDDLDARGISEIAFDDDACDRFAERIIDRFALVGKVADR